MIKNIYFLLSFLVISSLTGVLTAQNTEDLNRVQSFSPSQDELIHLSAIPELKLPDKYKGPNAPLLPSSIDNSTQPYFWPITSQTGYECGQSAGVAFTFTYEIDRLRNVPANTTVNQYPTHFVWDFLNNADNYGGASCFDSWEIVRACGTMNIADYGGLNNGGYLRWITGYNYYYNGMKNRINYMRAIRADSPEGLQTLKYWLFDHLEGSTVGGVGIFYGNYFGTPTTVLPTGTPEAGKYVEPTWGSSASHTWTCCGYNDSIRWDYNGDGIYTNNIDINGDGVVDMHDWEIGGLKFASGYAGTGWCDGGFCYLMYKDLADNIGFGGIWNHSIYVIDVKETCLPQLTMKINLKHTSRNKLKVNVGMNTDLAATTPAFTLDFPIYNYQGGDHYMQGGAAEADKTIEFGLDLTPLLSNLNIGQPAKWFLQVQENDPTGTATGEIVNWSLIDYSTGAANEMVYPVNNVAIANNAVTRLSLNRTLSFNKADITTAALPPANLYQPYSLQLSAINGTAPYLWDVKLDYPEATSVVPYPAVIGQQLTVNNNNSGYAVKTLPFNFPFYKKSINKLYIYSDGYILFDDQPFTWPYLIDKNLLFRETAIICPFMTDLCLYPAQGDAIWYQGDANSATIRWKVSVYGMTGTSSLNFAVKLYATGKIEYYYGTMNYPAATAWTGGLSAGDNKNWQYSLLNNASTITANTMDQFSTCGFPAEMQITDDGIFSGTPVNPYSNVPIRFMVSDANNISTIKTLQFSTNGLLVSYSVNSGGDSIIEYGETTNINMTVTNIGTQVVHNVYASIAETDPYISLADSTQSFGNLNPGQALTVNNAFIFNVSQNIPNNHDFKLNLHVTSTEQNFQKEIDMMAFAPEIRIGQVILQDGDNGRLDPGETTNMLVSFENHGGAKINNLQVTLSTVDTNLVINNGTGGIAMLKPDSVKTITFNITGGNDAPFMHLYLMNAALTAANGYSKSDSLYLFSGDIVEDFESAGFMKFNWFFGYCPWTIDPYQPKEGTYCTRSGWIFDNQESALELTVNVIQSGPITFWKKVDCENDPAGTNYDYLAFFIDNYEQGRWDGFLAWSQESFNVTPGYHTLKWVYHKDYSVSTGSDCAWVDFITFPPFEGSISQISASPLSFSKSVAQNETARDTLYITNTGGAILQYALIVFDTTANKHSRVPDLMSGSTITSNTEGFVPGQAFSWIFTVHNTSTDNEYIRHIKMEFPVGVVISNVSNYSGGSLGELAFQGSTGNGATLNWHGTSAGNRGVIKPGETASTTISGTIGESFNNDIFTVYAVTGDSVGAGPHLSAGNVKLVNYGLANTWLSLSQYSGSLFHNDIDTIGLIYNSQGLDPGTYSCSLVAHDLYNNKIVIPVVLQVREPVSINDQGNGDATRLTGNYPNPFRQYTTISYTLADPQQVQFEMFNIRGESVCTLMDHPLQPGEHRLTWNGTDNYGNTLPSGVYTCRMTTPGYTGTMKLILMR